MITLHDTLAIDLAHVDAMADMSEPFALFDYVHITQQNGQEWIGQIVEPNRNISTVGERLAPVILHGLKLMQREEKIRAVESVHVFKIRVMGIYRDDVLLTPQTRPLPGSVVKKLDSRTTIRILSLPEFVKGEEASNAIGMLLNADDIPLTINAHKFNHHIMVSGGTGSGKSNAAANLVYQAVHAGKCVLIHDAKPDYQLIREANTDKAVSNLWGKIGDKYAANPCPAQNVQMVGFKQMCDEQRMNQVLAFRASDFDPAILAGFFFPNKGEELQFENFSDAADKVRGNGDKPYTVADILDHVQIDKSLTSANQKAILRKVKTRKKGMPWLDPSDLQGGGYLASDTLDGVKKASPFSSDIIKKGRIIIVDYSGMDDDATYALLLSFFLRSCHRFCRNKKNPCGVVQLIDEAHRIFDNESPHENALASSFARVMREGRTLDHSIILSLQSASQIPGHVMTNLNSRIVMRQNSFFDARAATETMGKEYAQRTMSLGTGHALVSMLESRAVVLAQMFPSPYELMRADNSNAVNS